MATATGHEERMLVDGELVGSDSGRTFDNRNPATGEVLGPVADASAAQMHRAIDAARRAFDETAWPTDRALRERCLAQLQDALEAEREELREELILEVGCPRMTTHANQLDIPLEGALRYPAKLIDEFEWRTELPEIVDRRGTRNTRQVWKDGTSAWAAIRSAPFRRNGRSGMTATAARCAATWSGEGSLIGEVSGRMTGSSDLFNRDGRNPRASINHITVHDGFTLADLFSYNAKHNEANGEDNRDGANDNHSNNCGHEGPTDDPAITALRHQLRRNQLACLLLAQGVPLVLAGDEVGNTQNGNNNAYCQDNETGWVGWEGLKREGFDLTGFVGHMTEIRRRFPQIRARRWLDGRRADGSLRRIVADARRRRDEGAGLEIPGRPLSRLCARADRSRAAPDLHRAQRRSRSDHLQASEDAGIQKLAAIIEHRGC